VRRIARGHLTRAPVPFSLRLEKMPYRERYLFVCTNRRPDDNPKGSCAQKGSEELVQKLKEAVVARRAKDRVRVCSSGCLDLCETGASLVQEPDHVAYGGVTLADVDELADALVSGRVVERLVVHRSSTS
jgi:(2Fe-2S) ferredoxin